MMRFIRQWWPSILAALAVLVMLACAVARADAGWRWKWRAAYSDCYGCHAGYWYREHYEDEHQVRFSVSYDPDKAALLKAVEDLAKTARQQAETTDRLLGKDAGKTSAVPEGRAVLASRCTSCHATATATKGGDFVFADGLDRLTAGDKQRIRGRLNSLDPAKRMPPGQPLPEAERKAAETFLDAMPPAADSLPASKP